MIFCKRKKNEMMKKLYWKNHVEMVTTNYQE